MTLGHTYVEQDNVNHCNSPNTASCHKLYKSVAKDFEQNDVSEQSSHDQHELSLLESALVA